MKDFMQEKSLKKKKKKQPKDSHFVAFYLGIFLEGSSISSLLCV